MSQSWDKKVPVQPGAAAAAKDYKQGIKDLLERGFASTPEQVISKYGGGYAGEAMKGLPGSGLGYLTGGGAQAALEHGLDNASTRQNQLFQQALRMSGLDKKLNLRAYKYQKQRQMSGLQAQNAAAQMQNTMNFQNALLALGSALGTLGAAGYHAWNNRQQEKTPAPSTGSATSDWYPSWQDNLNFGNFNFPNLEWYPIDTDPTSPGYHSNLRDSAFGNYALHSYLLGP